MLTKKKLQLRKPQLKIYFINVGSKLTAKIPSSNTNFESYLSNITTSIVGKPLYEKEFSDAFFELKSNKSPG